MTRAVRGALAFVLVFSLATSAAWAQLNTAELNGQVTDNTGGVLPGVTVTVSQTETGLQRTVVTDGSGAYVMTALPTGPYELEVALQGFRTYLQTGLVLTVGATPTVNVELELGALEETITVEAAAPIVDVRSAGISAVVENEQILELPLQGRQVTDLIVLAGAAVQTGDAGGRHVQGGVRISVAGGLPTGIGYSLDGSSHNSRQSNMNLPLPFPDALQEFRVATSAVSAESGSKSGAAVNAVTKSGTNRFSGNAFEFLRDSRFNAPEHFAAFGPDGEQLGDGLKRHQYGFTLGGPIVENKLFFFGGYQGTPVRVEPTSQIMNVPTAAMLAGDFTTYASRACQGRRAITLGAPYVNNRIDPALFSPAAVNLAAELPEPSDECGTVQFSVTRDEDTYQPITRFDYQASNNHSFFVRYMFMKVVTPEGYTGPGDNILKAGPGVGGANRSHMTSIGETSVLNSTVVNSVRVGLNYSWVERSHQPTPDPSSIGVNITTQLPGQFPLDVDGEFEISRGGATNGTHANHTYAFTDDLTFLKGNHQFSIGANAEWSWQESNSTSRSNGNWIFDGRHTGTGISDLMVGRVFSMEQGGFGFLPVDNWYIGVYGQDSWRLSDRVTLNYGLRWEPYLGQNVRNGVVAVFDQALFDSGTKSSVYTRAPAGFQWDGDPGFPSNGKTGQDKQWFNFSPRVGLAWDVNGDGRTAVRTSWGLLYDFPAGEFHNIHANAPPFGNRLRLFDPEGGFDDPYLNVPGGNPFPVVRDANVPFVPFGSFGTMDPGINSPRTQSYNVTIEQQLGTDWQVAASYIGSYSDRLWAQDQLNPGIVVPGERATGGNLNTRRKLYRQNPAEAQFISFLDEAVAIGYQRYNGLKLSVRRRAASGLSMSGNYTLSKCTGTDTPNGFDQAGANYLIPGNPDFDNGYCDQDRKHLSTLTVGYLTPEADNAVLRAIASNWRVSTILAARTGARLNIESGRDTGAGTRYQRPNYIGSSIFGPGKDADPEPGERIIAYFDSDAFETPGPGENGNATRNLGIGPGYWTIDLAVSRLIPMGARQLELRLETFNLTNNFNWGNPGRNARRSSFGRIQSQAGTPRIMQLGVKFAF